MITGGEGYEEVQFNVIVISMHDQMHTQVLDKTNVANNAVITKHMLLTEVFPFDSSTYLFVPR